VPLLGLGSIAAPDTEADDLISSYTRAARARNMEVLIGTNDKDLFQLVDAGCKIYSTNKTDLASPTDPHALLGEDKVRDKWGVAPRLIADALALIGDTVDNIPGVSGLGPKTAASLLNEHGTLDAILANFDVVKNERTREKLRAAEAQIRSNREMVRLDDDLPLPVPLDSLRVTPRWPELIAALERCEFKTLTADVRKDAGLSAPALAPKAGQGELF
jgi:5'-3' exonuclease